jgi:hypothetical protein
MGNNRFQEAFYDRRWVARSEATLDAALRERGRMRRTGLVSNLSTNGCRVEMDEAMPVNGQAWITLPSLESRYSRVAWCRDGSIGVQFAEPLHPAVADMLISRSAAA